MHPSLSGVGVSRHTLPLIPAAALLVVVETHPALEARLLPTGHPGQALYRGPLGVRLLSASAAAAQGVESVLTSCAGR